MPNPFLNTETDLFKTILSNISTEFKSKKQFSMNTDFCIHTVKYKKKAQFQIIQFRIGT